MLFHTRQCTVLIRISAPCKPELHDKNVNVRTLGDVVGSGVHLDDLNVLVRHLGAQLVVDGGQLLAVAAPWGVELNQHVLKIMKNIYIKYITR